MLDQITKKINLNNLDKQGLSQGLHWTTVASEKLLLAIIGALTMGAAVFELFVIWEKQTIALADLFLFFIYAEIVGMVGAFYVSRRIPVTLPIIIAITALCRVLISQTKEIDPLVLFSASGAILILAGAAYVMSLKDKLSLEKEALRKDVVENKDTG
ncbi:MAG: phosphate-starvation-inducible E-like protein [Rhodospirillaceae bacterium]|nr:phosphate-starvation-inducible E-like protein [Rhodospirillaceae bacterium]|tara:strand:+ start:1457 stop:1927 length:471 start_codon:yes stop_codon:yes gene_type:complete